MSNLRKETDRAESKEDEYWKGQEVKKLCGYCLDAVIEEDLCPCEKCKQTINELNEGVSYEKR